jgi:hypothetical protein
MHERLSAGVAIRQFQLSIVAQSPHNVYETEGRAAVKQHLMEEVQHA